MVTTGWPTPMTDAGRQPRRGTGHAPAACQMRSPVRSECRPHRTMAMAEQIGQRADQTDSICWPRQSPLTICGRKNMAPTAPCWQKKASVSSSIFGLQNASPSENLRIASRCARSEASRSASHSRCSGRSQRASAGWSVSSRKVTNEQDDGRGRLDEEQPLPAREAEEPVHLHQQATERRADDLRGEVGGLEGRHHPRAVVGGEPPGQVEHHARE